MLQHLSYATTFAELQFNIEQYIIQFRVHILSFEKLLFMLKTDVCDWLLCVPNTLPTL